MELGSLLPDFICSPTVALVVNHTSELMQLWGFMINRITRGPACINAVCVRFGCGDKLRHSKLGEVLYVNPRARVDI